MLSFDVQNICRTFFFYLENSKYIRPYLVWCLFRSKYVFSFFFLQCNLELHEQRLSCSTSTFKNIIRAFLLPFLAYINTYILSCLFVDSVLKRNCCASVSTLTSENISGTLFTVCLFVNMFFLHICCILTWKCISHSHPFAVYTLNIPRTTYFSIYNR